MWLAVLLAAAGLLAGCGKGENPPTANRSSTPNKAIECLTTPNGIPRKVIVKTQGAYAYESPDFTGNAKPLKFFHKYFVFKEQAGKGCLVGEATTSSLVQDSIVGWVHSEDVLAWNHEQALFFINKQANGRVPVKLWMDKREIGRSDAPYFEEDLSARGTTEPFPILQKEGSTVRVAFLWGKPGALESVPVSQLDVPNAQTVRGEAIERGSAGAMLTSGGSNALPRMQAGLRRMDIVLVMDVTSSMGPYMEAVKQRMTQMVNQLANLSSTDFPIEAHIGVVAYRDYADAKTSFTTKRLDLTADRRSVDRFLAELQPASVGKDKYEAVFEGLSDAIDRMHWDPYSYKVMVLVGDAPPQGYTPSATPEPGVQSNSPFFSAPFNANLKTIHQKLEGNGIRFYALGVGNDPEMTDAFRQIVGASQTGGFQALAGASAFIAQLEVELRKQRENQAATGKIANSAIEKVKSGQAVSEAEQLVLNERNITPEKLAELAQNRIQTGWFDVEAVSDRVSVCVYLRRKDLEAMLIDLRSRARDGISAQELDVLKSILEPHIGRESLQNVKSIDDLMKVVSDLPLPPEVIRQIVGRYDDSNVTRVLRDKMNNIMILLLQKQLFNNYEEGWIPLEYLPGSMSSEH